MVKHYGVKLRHITQKMVHSEPTHGWTRAQKFHEHSPSKEPMGSTRKVYQKAISVTYKISQERNWSKQQRDGLFQLQIRISFPFLLAKDSRRFLFIMITRSFFTLLYLGGTYARLVYTWYKKNSTWLQYWWYFL